MGGAGAAPNLVRLCQGHTNAIAKLGQQLWVSLPNMLLSLLGKFYFTRQVRARKSHSVAPLKAPGMAANCSRQKTLVAASLPRHPLAIAHQNLAT
jgi:hypothetical protein